MRSSFHFSGNMLVRFFFFIFIPFQLLSFEFLFNTPFRLDRTFNDQTCSSSALSRLMFVCGGFLQTFRCYRWPFKASCLMHRCPCWSACTRIMSIAVCTVQRTRYFRCCCCFLKTSPLHDNSWGTSLCVCVCVCVCVFVCVNVCRLLLI